MRFGELWANQILSKSGYNIAATLNDVYLSRIYFGPDNTQSVGHRGFYLKESAEAGDGFVPSLTV